MFGSLKRFLFPEEFHVKSSVWHAALYLYWLSKGGSNKPSYQENWCHYWRVVLLYAPKRWCFEEKILWSTISPAWILWFFVASSLPTVLHLAKLSFVDMLMGWGLSLFLWVGFILMFRASKRVVKRLLPARKYDIEGWIDACMPLAFFPLAGLTIVFAVLAVVRWPVQSGIVVGGLVVVALAIAVARVAAGRVRDWKVAVHTSIRAEPCGVVARGVIGNILGTVTFAAQFVAAKKRPFCGPVVFDFNPQEALKKQQARVVER